MQPKLHLQEDRFSSCFCTQTVLPLHLGGKQGGPPLSPADCFAERMLLPSVSGWPPHPSWDSVVLSFGPIGGH